MHTRSCKKGRGDQKCFFVKVILSPALKDDDPSIQNTSRWSCSINNGRFCGSDVSFTFLKSGRRDLFDGSES